LQKIGNRNVEIWRGILESRDGHGVPCPYEMFAADRFEKYGLAAH